MKSYKKIVLSSVVIGAAMLLTGCGGATTGIANPSKGKAISAQKTKVSTSKSKNSYKAKGLGQKGSLDMHCYVYEKGADKTSGFMIEYKVPFIGESASNKYNFMSKKTDISSYKKMSKVDYELFTMQSSANMQSKCLKSSVVGFLSVSAYRTYVKPSDVEQTVSARTSKWTNYKNPFYRSKVNANKVLVYKLNSGDELAYPFSTEKEKEVIVNKVYKYDKEIVLDNASYAFKVSNPEVLNASDYSFDRTAQINEIIRFTGLAKVSDSEMKEVKREIARKWMTEKKKVKKAQDKKDAEALRVKREADMKAQKEAAKKREKQRIINNAQSVDL